MFIRIFLIGHLQKNNSIKGRLLRTIIIILWLLVALDHDFEIMILLLYCIFILWLTFFVCYVYCCLNLFYIFKHDSFYWKHTIIFNLKILWVLTWKSFFSLYATKELGFILEIANCHPIKRQLTTNFLVNVVFIVDDFLDNVQLSIGCDLLLDSIVCTL